MHFEKNQENILNLQFQTFQYQSISMYQDLTLKFLCEKLHLQLFLNELLKCKLSKNKRILKYVYMGNMERGGTILTRWLRQENSVFLCAFEFYCAVIKQGPDALLTSLNIWLLLLTIPICPKETFKKLRKKQRTK